jgi:hypothetical protein
VGEDDVVGLGEDGVGLGEATEVFSAKATV